MRSDRFLFIPLSLAFFIAGCGSAGSPAPSLKKDADAAPSGSEQCPTGQLFDGWRCRQQRGIIIDQRPKHPEIQGIIIDQPKIDQPTKEDPLLPQPKLSEDE